MSKSKSNFNSIFFNKPINRTQQKLNLIKFRLDNQKQFKSQNEITELIKKYEYFKMEEFNQ